MSRRRKFLRQQRRNFPQPSTAQVRIAAGIDSSRIPCYNPLVTVTYPAVDDTSAERIGSSKCPQKDLFHEKVKSALVKDGWTITDDPLTLTYETRDVFVDLGAERVLAAEKGTEKIAVEIKMFSMGSKVTALEDAVGQYIVYRGILEEVEPARKLYLAIPKLCRRGYLLGTDRQDYRPQKQHSEIGL